MNSTKLRLGIQKKNIVPRSVVHNQVLIPEFSGQQQTLNPPPKKNTCD